MKLKHYQNDLKITPIIAVFFVILFASSVKAQSVPDVNILDADGRVWVQKLEKILEACNAEWVAGDTPVSTMTLDERKSMFFDLDNAKVSVENEFNAPLPPETRMYGPAVDPSMSRMDWRDVEGEDWTSPVRQQGICGSCWAFGPIVVAETCINILKDNPKLDFDLAEQYLVSCSPFGSCAWGGQPSIVFNYMQSTGVPDENCMPYVSGDTGMDGSCANKCADWQQRAIKIQKWGQIKNSPQNYQAMKQQIVNGGLSLTMNVFSDFSAYSGGVYQHTSGTGEGGHCIAIVGWDDSHDSWIIKNSWGVMWGEDGFGEMRRGDVSINGYSTEWLVMPNPPLLGIPCPDPIEIEVDAYQDSLPGQEKIEIRNCGEDVLHWSAEPFYGAAEGWMSVEPAKGALAVGDSETVTIHADPEGLSPRISRNSGVTILGDHRNIDVSVTFKVLKAKAPSADFSADPVEGKSPLKVSFESDISGTFNVINWDFGDGSNSSELNSEHEYSSPGQYTVMLEVSGSRGSDSIRKENFIKVMGDSGGDPPEIDPDNPDTGSDPGVLEEFNNESGMGGCGCIITGRQDARSSLSKLADSVNVHVLGILFRR